jgi:hypothetical protein
MLVRVTAFGADHAVAFASQAVAARTFEEVRVATSVIEQHEATQASARARDGVARKAVARKRLRESLRVIGRTARALALDAPGVRQRFCVPKTNGDRSLVTAARGFRRESSELATEFQAHELPPSFFANLDAELAAFEQAADEYVAVRQTGTVATAGVDEVLARATTSIRRLDAIVANVFAGDAPTIAAWRLARRVGRKRRAAQSLGGQRFGRPCSSTTRA